MAQTRRHEGKGKKNVNDVYLKSQILGIPVRGWVGARMDGWMLSMEVGVWLDGVGGWMVQT